MAVIYIIYSIIIIIQFVVLSYQIKKADKNVCFFCDRCYLFLSFLLQQSADAIGFSYSAGGDNICIIFYPL